MQPMITTNRRIGGLLVALVLALAATAAGAGTASSSTAGVPSAQVSGLTKQQKKAKRKALKRCRKKRAAKQRKACLTKVRRKYRRLARKRPKPPAGKTYLVDVEDDYFQPDVLTLKVYDWIDWTWRNSTVREGHNVNLTVPFPSGVIAGDFQSPGVVTGPGGRFKRQFTRPGTYNLYCNLHAGMTMTVSVRK